ncbi:MAG: VanZ family protein [Magnetococcus sp. YQC-9]
MQYEVSTQSDDTLTKSKKFLYIGLLIGYSVVIYLISSVTGQELPEVLFDNQDKVEHMLAYGFMAFIAWIAIRQLTTWRRPWLWAWLYCVGYGVTDEWHQLFVPGRYGDLVDLLADATGAALAVLMLEYYRHYRSRQPSEAVPVLVQPQPVRIVT